MSDDTIESVSISELLRAIEEKKLDEHSEKIINKERQYIEKWRQKSGKQNSALAGLALSGGGIRSATFSLGILQALARHNLLKKFDYLSTVSGGGYIGSAMSWAVRQKADESRTDECLLDKDTFPFGSDDPQPDEFDSSSLSTNDPLSTEQTRSPESPYLRFFRRHGRFLNPGSHTNLLTLLNTILRGTMLNLFTWLPLLIAGFLATMYLSESLSTASYWFTQHPIKQIIINEGLGVILSQPYSDSIMAIIQSRLIVFEWLLYVAIFLLLSMFVFLFLYSWGTFFGREKGPDFSYVIRRTLEKRATLIMMIVGLLFVIGTLPFAGLFFLDKFSAFGPLAVIAGVGVVFRQFFAFVKDNKVSIGIGVTIGSVLLIYSVLLASLQSAILLYEMTPLMVPNLILLLLVFSAAVGILVNINYISIHRFYRDRLMESFMPDRRTVLDNETGHTKSMLANKAYLKDFAEAINGPYPIINTNVVLVNGSKYIYTYRGGDNFILSPYFCGSNATGWAPTEEYMDGKMTMATAVAISGAAVNPNTGVGGDGVTRNKLLSLVMSLLNLRLGYWAHHPKKKPLLSAPNHFSPGIYPFLNFLGPLKGNTEDNAFLELSDGGHFENTGVYELIRRRTRLILVCDGGEDHDFTFSDFQTTVRRIEDDFGVTISVDSHNSPDKIVPSNKSSDNGATYPKNTGFAQQGYTLAKITYADGAEGYIIYLKTTLQKQVSFKVKGYKAQNADFPDQSTADQFFDEVQFEAYRELGYQIATQMIEELKLTQSDAFFGHLLQ